MSVMCSLQALSRKSLGKPLLHHYVLDIYVVDCVDADVAASLVLIRSVEPPAVRCFGMFD